MELPPVKLMRSGDECLGTVHNKKTSFQNCACHLQYCAIHAQFRRLQADLYEHAVDHIGWRTENKVLSLSSVLGQMWLHW